MIVKCEKCRMNYDDADRLTICPHYMLMSLDDLEQKEAALALIRCDICFAHMPKGPLHRVQSVNWNGMVTLHGMIGEFAPHLFVIADEQK